MFYRIIMNVIHVPSPIFFITDEVFPISSLPYGRSLFSWFSKGFVLSLYRIVMGALRFTHPTNGTRPAKEMLN